MKFFKFIVDYRLALLMVLVNTFVLTSQLLLEGSKYSYWGQEHWGFTASISPKILKFYCLSIGSVLFGSFLANTFTSSLTDNLFRDHKYEINISKLKAITLIVALVIICLIILTQFFLGNFGLYYLWTGQITPEQLEVAIRQSPFGLNGILQIFAIIGVLLLQLLWENKDLGRYKSLIFICSFLGFVSHGKIKGVIYLFVAFFLKRGTSSRKKIISATVLGLIFLLIFFTTRILRNISNDWSASFDTFLTMLLGYYTGSPFYNTCYILDHLSIVPAFDDFYRYLVPQRLFDGALMPGLPDSSSPAGLFGNGLMLGGIYQCMVYLALIGFICTLLGRLSRTNLGLRLFMPFLVVACFLSFLHDHFVNFMQFWIPLMMCIFFSKYVTRSV